MITLVKIRMIFGKWHIIATDENHKVLGVSEPMKSYDLAQRQEQVYVNLGATRES